MVDAMPARNVKCDDDLKLHVPSELKSTLASLAKKKDRTLGDYARHVLTRHVIVEKALQSWEGATQGE